MEVVDLGFTRLEFESDFIVVRVIEGVDIDSEHHRQLAAEIEKRTEGDYGLILDEVNSYSVRLGALMEMRQNPRLKCIAMIAYRPATHELARMYAGSINKPSQACNSIPEARVWIRAHVES